MPMPGAPVPPQISAAPANVGPVTVPQGNPGNISAAIKKVQAGVHMFEEALPMIPMSSPLHAKLLKITAEVAKEMAEIGKDSGADSQGQMQALMQALRGTAQSAPMAAMSRMFPQQAPPNAPPAMAGGGAPPPPAGA